MATTIVQAFKEYSPNLNLTDRQVSLVSSRRENVTNAISRELSLHTEKSKVIGSWDRKTLTRYLFEGDVDLMVILHYGDNQSWDGPDGALSALAKFKRILQDAYPNSEVRIDGNCVTVKFSEFRLDVVPAFKYDAGFYRIPNTTESKWIQTNPFDFADKITAVNKSMDGTFVPLIKMVKGWNRNIGWPIRSFHLECIMYRHYQHYAQGYTYNSMLNVFFDRLPEYLRSSCYDPVTYERVDSYLTSTKRDAAVNKAERAARKSTEAYEDESKYESVAISEWKDLLGEFFPTYG